MTLGLLGQVFHKDGDGCTGDRRPLSALDTHGIQHEARHLLTAIAAQDYDAAARRGGGVALHYGPEGEWFLCSLLAEYIRRSRTHAARDTRNLPQITLSVPPDDPQALALLSVLVMHHRQRAHLHDQRDAMEASRLPLQTFMLHMAANDRLAARRQWEHVFHRADGALALAALGFTAQLVLWASRSTATTATAPRTPAPQAR